MDKPKDCDPRIVPKVVKPPPDTMPCVNCGCEVAPGTCHCGAENQWRLDPLEGWYRTGKMPSVIVG